MEFVRKNADLKITKIGLIADKVFGLCNQKPNILDAFKLRNHCFTIFINQKAQVSCVILGI